MPLDFGFIASYLYFIGNARCDSVSVITISSNLSIAPSNRVHFSSRGKYVHKFFNKHCYQSSVRNIMRTDASRCAGRAPYA